jgi:hypothetical protein
MLSTQTARNKVKVKGKAIPVQAYYRTIRYHGVQAHRFIHNRHIKVVGCQPFAPAAFTPQEVFLILVSVRD